MNVLAINGSPKMDKGQTSLILTPFLEGMTEAGASVELVYTKELDISPCQGEFNCWLKTPGRCFQNDDMQGLLPKLSEADVWVFATPVYVDGVSGPTKNLLDRMIPLAQPFIELRDGHCYHSWRERTMKGGRIVLVSNCGYWEMDNFDPLLVHMKAVCRNVGMAFGGALLRPHGPVLRRMLRAGEPVTDVLDAAKDCGRQLILDGEMAPETLAVVGRELEPLDKYLDYLNARFQNALDELTTDKAASSGSS